MTDDRIENKICLHCGYDIIRRKKEGWNVYRKRKFCSNKCRIEGMVGR